MQNLKIKWVLVGLIYATNGLALDSDRNAKIVIQGPNCVSKLKEYQTECKKGLTIEQGSLLIKSTYGLIHHQDNDIQKVLMEGDQVYMEQMMEDQTKMVIQANQIDYRKAEDKVILKGQVNIKSAIGVTTGEHMEFNLKTQEINALGDAANQQFKMEIDQKDD